MRKKSPVALYLPILLAALVCALTFASGILKKPRIFENVVQNDMRFDRERLAYSLADGDAYGVLDSRGPGWNLSAGEYRLHWIAAGDGEAVLRLKDGNGAAIQPEENELKLSDGEGDIRFTLAEACEDLQFELEFVSGTYMEIYDIRVYTPEYQDDAFTLLFFAALMSALWLMINRGRVTVENIGACLFMALAVLISCSVAMKSTFNIGHDGVYHLARIQNLADGLKSGQFPVRMGGFSYDGYGAITSVFYPDVFLYPFALMLLGGASVAYVGNALSIAVNIAAALSMYVAAKKLFKNRWAAVCASILYTLAIYRLTDVYTRVAVGEMLAMAFFPLFIWSLWEVVMREKEHWTALALSACGIFLSHMISTLLCAALAAAFCLLNIRRIVREKRLLPLFKAVGLCLLLCLFQIVPLMTYTMQGIGAGNMVNDLTVNSMEPGQLFSLGQGSLDSGSGNGKILTFAVEIGLPLLIGAVLALYAALGRKERGQSERMALTFVAAGAILALMATDFFPWGILMRLTGGKIGYIQFTWRLMMLVTPLLALAGGYGFAEFGGNRQDAAAVGALCLAALCAMPTLSRELQSSHTLEQGANISPYLGLAYSEYTLPGTYFRDTWDRNVYTEGDVSVDAVDKQGTTMTMQVDAVGGGRVTLPLFGFDGYRAQVDGQDAALSREENNRLAVNIPAGTSGTLRVWFAGKAYWHIADAVSLAALVLLAGRKIRRKAGRTA